MTYQNARIGEDGHSTRSVYCLVAYRWKITEKRYRLGILLDRSQAMPVRCLGRISSVLSLDKRWRWPTFSCCREDREGGGRPAPQGHRRIILAAWETQS